ncbi:BTAD domain-containing putative transcriptional regulator [Kribbella sp. NPDC056345]|uniref:AfsR/SARP family transcriptional regulator n=1 Tax=Kribbella sp. NPDC056345 TaxID=3345789 RepID=UPI0035D9660A
MLEIRLLGPLEIVLDGRMTKLPGRRLAALMTILALSPSTPIPVEVIADRLWGEQLPHRAKPTLHTYIARLRRLLGDDAFETLPYGYRLRVEPDQVDAIRLATLVREAQYQSDDTRKRRMLETAAGLWRDVPFAGVEAPDWLTSGEAARLTELYLSALEQRIDLDLAAGRYGGLPTELQELTARHPLREPLWVRLLTVLRLTGRTAQALECYEQVRTIVADELGVDPAPALQQEFALLVAPRTAQPATPAVLVDNGAPRQLPPYLRTFTGRAVEQQRLDELLTDARADRPTIVTLTGPGGVGKTSLSVRWANTVRDQFPDGQLFVDLRGFATDVPVLPGEALAAFLRSLQVPANEIPPETSDRAALFRTMTADRRLLLILDNARNAEQVRPLLPASGSLTLITSRNQLRSLGPAGAVRLPIEPLPAGHAVDLLIDAVGADRVAAETAAVTELTARCAGLPLALAIAAEAAGRIPGRPFTQLVSALRDEKRRLDVFADPDDEQGDLRQVLSWSYQALEPENARLFRRLGLLPAGSISAPVAAALVDSTVYGAERRLDQLEACHLVSRIHPGQYQMHDLVRTYAAELATQVDDKWGESVGQRNDRERNVAVSSLRA